jgi:hypothetical protein
MRTAPKLAMAPPRSHSGTTNHTSAPSGVRRHPPGTVVPLSPFSKLVLGGTVGDL